MNSKSESLLETIFKTGCISSDRPVPKHRLVQISVTRDHREHPDGPERILIDWNKLFDRAAMGRKWKFKPWFHVS